MFRKFFALLLIWFVPYPACAEIDTSALQNLISSGVKVDLREPVFSDGVLSTTKGGVITAPNIRIQAQKIRYTRKTNSDKDKEEETSISLVEAEGHIMFEYKGRVFIGETMEYDFIKQEGIITEARTGIDTWFLGGDTIHLCPDGSFTISNAFVTTCENVHNEWHISAKHVLILQDDLLSASNVTFNFIRIPLFWLPRFKANFKIITDSPISYRIGFGGHQGLKFRMRYRIFSWREWETFLRLDYLLRRGLGGGVEMQYHDADSKSFFMSRNYLANDLSILNPSKHFRYRIEGHAATTFDEDKYDVHLNYDILSDKDMASDYADKDFNLKVPQRSEFLANRYHEDWIANLIVRARLNTFQTVRQELPSLRGSIRPVEVSHTGIITETRVHAGYLDYQFAKDIPLTKDFNSTRAEIRSTAYRPFTSRPFTFTPEVGGLAIHYGNSPTETDEFVGIAMAGAQLHTHMSKQSCNKQQIAKPYIRFLYLNSPTSAPTEHFIFDIDDGWWSAKLLTVGHEHIFLRKCNDRVHRQLVANFWFHALFDTPTVAHTIPRIYSTILWNASECISVFFDTAWDTARSYFDHFNVHSEITLSQNLAFSAEFRHRREFSWRKTDHTNFILDFFQSENTLRDSSLSDRRNTFLFHIYYRISRKWILDVESRHGWARKDAPTFNEFDVNMTTALRCRWYCRFSYQHREFDERFSFNISLGDNKPKRTDRAGIDVYR